MFYACKHLIVIIVRLEGFYDFVLSYFETFNFKNNVQEVGFEPTNLGRGSKSFEDLCH